MSTTQSPGGLETLDMGTLKVPETRMRSAADVAAYVDSLVQEDSQRSLKRARVNGLIDGNPPYKASKLREAGRADAANVNWNRAKSYMETGAGAFYDLFSEAPGYVIAKANFGTPEQRDNWSAIEAEEFDALLKSAPEWDYEMQVSLWNMVLHGCGPMMFEDTQRILPKAFLAGDLKVPEFTKSDTHYWESAAILGTYYPPELYDFIKNEDAAARIGWDVEHTKKVIANAMGIRNKEGNLYEWEFYQQELKNNSLTYTNRTKICRIAHVYWKEFDGRVTHAIVERNSSTGLEFLFRSDGRYDNFAQAIHPMYYDHGNGGYHHSVTALGVLMYAAMNAENRLICNLYDKAFAPKLLFKPTTAQTSQKFQLAKYGDYAVVPPGTDAIQNPMAGLMDDGVAMYQLLTGLNSDVLSSYRQAMPPAREKGNPPTKFQKQMEMAMLSALSKTQFNRFYAQLDQLYKEIWRRATNLNSTDERAKDFQERCKKRGVPVEALQRTDVSAMRVIGQGSAFMRRQAIDSLLPVAAALPEDGRNNLIADKVAAEAGQAAVNRYMPRKQQQMANNHQAMAMVQVAAMKVGVPPAITSDQPPVEYAAIFLQAAQQSIASLNQGGDPMQVVQFLGIVGPAIRAHLERFANDPTRKPIYDAMLQQWEAVAAASDKIGKQLLKLQAQKRDQMQRTQQMMSDEQLKAAKVQSDIRMKQVKTAAQLKQSEEKHRLKLLQSVQDMQLADASTAADIQRNRLRAFQE